jgi:hypothetical protein
LGKREKERKKSLIFKVKKVFVKRKTQTERKRNERYKNNYKDKKIRICEIEKKKKKLHLRNK